MVPISNRVGDESVTNVRLKVVVEVSSRSMRATDPKDELKVLLASLDPSETVTLIVALDSDDVVKRSSEAEGGSTRPCVK
jgi:hypothetical protein